MRAPEENSTALFDIQANLSSVEAGEGWSSGRQAGMQAAALGTTIGMAIVGGIITGECLWGVLSQVSACGGYYHR